MQYKIGDIYNITDGLNADCFKLILQPLRTGGNGYIADANAAVPRAGNSVLYRNLYRVFAFKSGQGLNGRKPGATVLFVVVGKISRNIAGYAPVAHCVHSVGRKADFK